MYPNASDPLNGEAAALMMRDRATYDQRVKGIDLKITYVSSRAFPFPDDMLDYQIHKSFSQFLIDRSFTKLYML